MIYLKSNSGPCALSSMVKITYGVTLSGLNYWRVTLSSNITLILCDIPLEGTNYNYDCILPFAEMYSKPLTNEKIACVVSSNNRLFLEYGLNCYHYQFWDDGNQLGIHFKLSKTSSGISKFSGTLFCFIAKP